MVLAGHVENVERTRHAFVLSCLLAGISKISPSSVPSVLRLDSPECINGRSVGEWVSKPPLPHLRSREKLRVIDLQSSVRLSLDIVTCFITSN